MTYGAVTFGFDLDLDANTVTIGDATVALEHVNAVLVDRVDEEGARRISATPWTEPRLPLLGDMNVEAVRNSPELIAYLRCDVPMPPASSSPRQPRVVTVCEKLRKK
jgi:hypothetical protein